MILFIMVIFVTLMKRTINVDATINKYQEKIETLMKKDVKEAYLTFDDGPTKKETEKILDILKNENVKATFFVVGKHVKELPQIVKREYEEGHYLANHGYTHNNSKLYSNFLEEVTKTDQEIGKAIGNLDYCSHIFRFPNGYMSKSYKYEKNRARKILNKLDYGYIDWNCLNKDSEVKISNTQLIENLKKTSKNKKVLVILMHDTGDVNNSSEVLKESIMYLKNEGYEFKNMYDLFNK